MYVRNLSGDEYALQATATWQSEISGNRTMSLTVLPTKSNNVFIADIAEMWVITDDDDVAHKVVYTKRQGVGDMLTVDIKAVPLFFDDFDNLRIYEEYNRHMTAMAAFTLIFADTGYNFVLHDSHDSVEWEGFGGGESRLETFKRALNRYGAEFEISGNTVHLKALIGRDTQFQYRHRLNASNIVQEIDASGFWTYAKGYGNYGDGEGGGDWQDAKLIREYTSPLAQIPGIGLRHAPPIKDGRVSVVSAMDKALKSHVDNSLKVSVTTDIHDLRKQGYALAQPELGDRVFLTDERISFDEEVRVVAMSITKDWRGEVVHFSITIGDEGVTKRHQANMSTAIDNIANLMAGTQKLPNSVLSNAILQATTALQNAQTELTFGTNGILAIDKVDPNYVTILNSKGVGVSIDGGATFGEAITGRGINASYIVAGVLDAGQVVVRGGSATEYTLIDGPTFESRGQFTKTWFGVTATHDVRYRIAGGLFRAESMTDDKRLYYSHDGIATYYQGSNEGDDGTAGSGVIEFFSHMYNATVRGLTLYSNRGVLALKTATRDIVLDSGNDVKLDGRYVSVVKDFALQANSIQNRTDDTNFYIGVSGTDSGELRVTSKTFWGGSHESTNYRAIRAGGLHAKWMVAPELFMYLGSDSGVRVTSRGINTNDPLIYRPIYASEFPVRSSISSKTEIEDMSDPGLPVINKMEVKQYYLQSDVDEGIYDNPQVGLISELSPEVALGNGNFVSLNRLVTYNVKATQELSDTQVTHGTDITGLYDVVGVLIEEIDKLKGVS